MSMWWALNLGLCAYDKRWLLLGAELRKRTFSVNVAETIVVACLMWLSVLRVVSMSILSFVLLYELWGWAYRGAPCLVFIPQTADPEERVSPSSHKASPTQARGVLRHKRKSAWRSNDACMFCWGRSRQEFWPRWWWEKHRTKSHSIHSHWHQYSTAQISRATAINFYHLPWRKATTPSAVCYLPLQSYSISFTYGLFLIFILSLP